MALTERYLTADVMNNIQTQMLEIQKAIVEAGYDSPEIVTDFVSWQYVPSKIKSLFNNQEANTRKIDWIADWINPYSSSSSNWARRNGMFFEGVNRWFLWAEFNKKIIDGEQQKQQYLFDKFEDMIVDINGDKISVFAGYFNT